MRPVLRNLARKSRASLNFMIKLPQLEDGYTRIANGLLEAMSLYPFTGGEIRTLLVILRSTYGYNRKVLDISLAQLSKKTNLTRRHIANILKSLRESSVIVVAKAGNKNVLGINKEYTRWKLWISDWSKTLDFTTQMNPTSPKW